MCHNNRAREKPVSVCNVATHSSSYQPPKYQQRAINRMSHTAKQQRRRLSRIQIARVTHVRHVAPSNSNRATQRRSFAMHQ